MAITYKPQTRDRTNEIIKALAPYPKFDLVPLRLEYAFDDSWWRSITTTDQDRSQLTIELGKDGLYTEALRHGPSCDLSPVDALRTYLASLPTQTAISSAIRILVRLLLLYTARSRRASHLLLGMSLTTLSISLISCISQGGGHSMREEFQEEWYHGIPATTENADAIRVVRPLRDVTMKECSMFAWWNSIHVVGRNGQIRATAGIPGLTKGTAWAAVVELHDLASLQISLSVWKKIIRRLFPRLLVLVQNWNLKVLL
ncbi:hypothetical protein JVT61DRAFT_6494 [Boletus reticuloceps]|uniref:Uncharacterized protein n=1 Tax=Boletus reticuloceps TaxID=495285 RepID=A0A8I2YK38_9AGAM|nr:hypothetical protein JVT61DRAFT_6494 [Boletus reticuloceps]